jgi:hypothetical protein
MIRAVSQTPQVAVMAGESSHERSRNMNWFSPRSRRRAGIIVIVLLAFVAVSCKGPRKPLSAVRGKVVYAGKPTPGAVVYFHPVTTPAPSADGKAAEIVLPRGKVEEDGSFQIGTYTETDGAAPGEYTVTIQWLGKSKWVEEEEVSLLPSRYLTPQGSGLRAKVLEGPTELPPFVLQR